jgi:Holliday junction resolvase
MLGTDRRNPSHRTTIQQGRAAEFLALAILRKKGFTVIRSAGPDSLIHLIAWEEQNRPIFVRVKRARRPVSRAAEVASRWPGDIEQLQKLPLAVGGSVQFWIYSGQQGWLFYEVLPGGIVEVRE